jgi:MFS family permease
MTARARTATIAVTGAALFMVVLDNLIVAATLPTLQRSLHTSLDSVEWVIDAYILTFGVALLTGAALGDRCSSAGWSCSPPRRPRRAWSRVSTGWSSPGSSRGSAARSSCR